MSAQTKTLQPVREIRWRSGFGNLLHKENGMRWGGRRWVVPALIWIAIMNGIVTLIAFADKADPSMAGQDIAAEAIDVFVQIGIFATAIGIVIGVQGAIIREKQLGTAAWILSKPASRSAFILSKWLAYSISAVILSLVLPAVVFFIQSQIFWGKLPAPIPFFEAWLIMVLNLQFYLALTLMLGTLFNARGAVAGIGLGFLFSGSFLPMVLPSWLASLFPWSLQNLAGAMAAGKSLPDGWQIPVIATAIWIPIFIGIALWRFGREEF
jgi:ABC-2 type transport system permease protein